ncbi:MAG: GCN5-related N-acetyltransferase [Actinomycetia bacterium]|nr:GCN5-related N-acetyltransferase [Actinomycetes bacterium]
MTPAALEALCAASMPEEQLSERELERICFGEGDTVFGDERAAAAYTIKRYGDYVAAWLLLVAVHPDAQGKGLGKQLVTDVCDRAREAGASHVHLANAVPRYVWPGIDLANTRAGMLFETLGFEADLVCINMSMDTGFRRDAPAGVIVERETGNGAVEFAQREYPYWVDELAVAVANGNAFAARRDDGSTIGFACHSVNRRGWIGPMATEPSRQHGGVGSALVSALCSDLAAHDVETAEICWVSNLRFYGKCGATVSRVFQGARLAL